ncbi:MAG: exodeoxyribonuclease VII large subunit [Hyphomicrobiaceae bacterium]
MSASGHNMTKFGILPLQCSIISRVKPERIGILADPTTDHSPNKTNASEFTVTELSAAIKRSIEDGFAHVRLRGEISGYRGPHASGHCYFALKDERAKIEAVVWRGVYAKLRIKPEEGMEVVAQGRVTTYANSSKYQIVIDSLEPAGVGALMALLEERKKKLTEEGLFEEDRKQRIPFLPRAVGVVTSPTGAVIRDMLHGFRERFPVHVILWPVRVQGDGSADEIAAAVRGFNALNLDGPITRPDVIIVARGGGSLEDLWSFNEEKVVRAVASSEIPLISAVGHETDWTLIDFAADARAPTPTKAAEWAVPMFSDLSAQKDELAHRLALSTRRRVEVSKTLLRAAARGLPRPRDLVAMSRQRFDAVERRLAIGLQTNTRAHATRLTRVAGRLSPSVLRGHLSAAKSKLVILSRRNLAGYQGIVHRTVSSYSRLTGRLNPATVRHRSQRARERYDALRVQLDRGLHQRVSDQKRRLETLSKLISSLGYHSVLRRGFAVVRDRSGKAVRSARDVATGMTLNVEVMDGQFEAETRGPTAPPEVRAKPGSVREAVKNRGRQGSLF